MKLPLLISVPHAGLKVPPEVRSYCALTPQQILKDSDEGATDIYALASEVKAFVTTDIARAVVDLNRPENDRRPDGVVKTHTCWNVPVYHTPLDQKLIQTLLSRYYRPYHQRLTELAPSAMLGIDCHTMSSIGPPSGPDPDSQRPDICLSNAYGTCPPSMFDLLIDCLRSAFGCEVSVNSPFGGGHIIRTHACELPWIQLELSRAPYLGLEEKHNRILKALSNFCDRVCK